MTRLSRRKRLLFIILACCAPPLLLLGGAEAFLRVQAWRNAPPEGKLPDVPLHEDDPEAGWRNRAGQWEFPYERRDDVPRTVTIWEDHSRATAPEQVERSRKVVLLGGSFMQGWGAPDSRTVGWRLQEALPDAQVLNYGTGAYGTYQSFVRLRRLLRDGMRPRVVVYGFIDSHDHRNVVDPAWYESIKGQGAEGPLLPAVRLADDGSLTTHAMPAWPRWPLQDALRSVRAANRAWVRWSLRDAREREVEVTEALLKKMHDLCRENGAEFVVATFLFWESAERRTRFYAFAEEAGIQVVDCEVDFSGEKKVPGDGHPEGSVHEEWAARLAPVVEKALSGTP